MSAAASDFRMKLAYEVFLSFWGGFGDFFTGSDFSIRFSGIRMCMRLWMWMSDLCSSWIHLFYFSNINGDKAEHEKIRLFKEDAESLPSHLNYNYVKKLQLNLISAERQARLPVKVFAKYLSIYYENANVNDPVAYFYKKYQFMRWDSENFLEDDVSEGRSFSHNSSTFHLSDDIPSQHLPSERSHFIWTIRQGLNLSFFLSWMN